MLWDGSLGIKFPIFLDSKDSLSLSSFVGPQIVRGGEWTGHGYGEYQI